MKTKLNLLSISIVLLIVTSCKSQEKKEVVAQIEKTEESITRVEASIEPTTKQSTTSFPKVKNNIDGELDYTKNELELSITQVNGENISIGKINKEGNIYFDMPEFDIRAIHEEINLGTASLTSMFEMVFCKDKDELKNPYDNEIYSHKYNAILINKYGIPLAVLHPVSNQKVLKNNHYNADTLSLGSEYYWFYIDRAIDFNFECDYNAIKTADIHLNKGWNFIKEELVEIQDVEEMEGYHNISPKKISFYTSNYKDSEIEWYIDQQASDDVILLAKKLYYLTPLTKNQFVEWVPKKLGDLPLLIKEYGSQLEGQQNKNTIKLEYGIEEQNKNIEVYIIDCAKHLETLFEAKNIYAMDASFGKSKENLPYVAQYDEDNNESKLVYIVNDRMVVYANSVAIKPEELWGYIQKLNIQKLVK